MNDIAELTRNEEYTRITWALRRVANEADARQRTILENAPDWIAGPEWDRWCAAYEASVYAYEAYTRARKELRPVRYARTDT